MTDPERTEDLAQLIIRIKDTHGVNESEIARRLGIAPATVNAWVLRKRGTKRGPNRETLRHIAAEFGIPEREVFEAANRKTPGELSPNAEERLLKVFRDLTAEQQRSQLIQMKALAEDNQTSAS